MTTAVIWRRLRGVVFLVVVISLVALSIAKYSGAFERGVPVTLRAEHTGLQLEKRSDVKVRGLIVGEVTDVSSSGDGAVVRMMLKPELVRLIPDNVSARLLPKTLFGEKYVSLVLPDRSSGRPLSAGDVIPQDRSQPARELESALDSLLPLLQAVRPQELASTLGALSGALRGRGHQLGDTLVRLQQLVSGLDTALPELRDDITRTAGLADTYSRAAPDLLTALADLTTTSRTVFDQRRNLSELFSSVTGVSDDLRGFLRDNRENLIALASDSRPTLESLARYAPEYPCLLHRIAGLVPKIDRVFGVGTTTPGVHVYLKVVNNRGKYLPGVDGPRYDEDRGPRCYPVLQGAKFPQYPGGPIQDGSTAPPPGMAPGMAMGLPNSPAERQFIAALLGSASGERPAEIPGWTSFLVGPLLRATVVTLR
ncbi:MAG: MCE family protein [Pseudonocardiaceae bacterium]